MIAGPPIRKFEMDSVAFVIPASMLFNITKPKLGPAPTKSGM